MSYRKTFVEVVKVLAQYREFEGQVGVSLLSIAGLCILATEGRRLKGEEICRVLGLARNAAAKLEVIEGLEKMKGTYVTQVDNGAWQITKPGIEYWMVLDASIQQASIFLTQYKRA